MTKVPSKIAPRLAAGLRKFQPILAAATSRDANESDTVVIVTDLLHEVFGYDKYSEITREQLIRGTYCDLAVKLEGGIAMLIEVKAIGLDLKDQFVKQAVDYASNQGCEWVALTNAVTWRVYRLLFTKPIEHELVLEFNLSELNPRSEADLSVLWLLARESWQKAGLGEYCAQEQARSRFLMAAVLTSDPVLDVMRRELRRISPDVKTEANEIKQILVREVIKREALEGEKADAARKLVAKSSRIALRSRASRSAKTQAQEGEAAPPPT